MRKTAEKICVQSLDAGKVTDYEVVKFAGNFHYDQNQNLSWFRK